MPHSAALLLGLQETLKACAAELDLVAGDPYLAAVRLALARVEAQLAIADKPFASARFAQMEGLVDPVTHVLLGPMHAVCDLHAGQTRSDLDISELSEA